MATNPNDLFADLVPQQGKAIYGPPPKPKDPGEAPETWRTMTAEEASAQGYSPAKVYQVSSRGNVKVVGDANQAATLTDQDKADLKAEALQKLRLGVGLIKRSREGWFTTGFGAPALAAVSSASPAGAVKADTATLKNAGALQRVIELSKKTGKNPLTPLSNSDFEALANSIANLDIGQPDEQYQRNVGTVLDIYKRAYLAAGGDQKDIDAILNQAGAGNDVTAPSGATPENGGGGGGGLPGVGELNADQQAKDKAFLATNPTPEQYAAFLSTLTNRVADPKAAAARLKAAREGGAYSGTTVDPTYQEKVKQRLAAEDKLGVGSDAATTLATQGGTLNLSDEAAGVGNALAGIVAAPFTGKLDIGGDYRFGRDVERQRIANAREQLGYGGTAIELTSSLASAAPTAALSALTGRQAAVAAGKSGAVGGALAGFGTGEGTEQSVTGAGVGAAVGGALGRYAPAAVERILPRRFRPSPAMAPDVAQAADAEGVDLIRPMVDPRSLPQFGELESNRFSQPIIRNAVERTRGQIADRAEALGGGGTALDEEAAGTLAQTAGRRFIQRSRNVANRLYDRARNLAGNARFEPTQAIGQVDNEIAQLSQNPETNAGEISFLQGLRRDLATPGGKTVEDLRQLRTSLRGRISEQNLTATQAEARAIRAIDAAQQDIAANVPQAASAYRRADAYYRERQTHIDDIIERVTGGRVGTDNYQKSGEEAFRAIKGMAQKDGRRLAALMRDLSPNERQDIAASLAARLGRAAPDQPFSAARFIANTNGLSPSARRTIFGPDGAQSVQNLRTLSRALIDAGQDINRSRSGTLLERTGWRRAAYGLISSLTGIGTAGGALAAGGTGGVAGGLAGAAVAGTAMAASAGVKRLSARAMVNPRLTRWLADSLNVGTQRQAQEATRRLGVIIAREPALAAELQPIYQSLQQRVTQPLAAQPQSEGQDNGQ